MAQYKPPPFTTPLSLGQQALDVVLHELREVPEELGGVRAVDVAVVAGDGHRHLLLHLERAVLLFLVLVELWVVGVRVVCIDLSPLAR